jgi:chloride channel 7
MKSDEDTPLFADGAPREPSIRNVLFNLSDDLESTSHAHVYSGVEQERLKDAESIDYLAPSSRVYKNWLSRQVWGRHWDRWVVMALIGVLMGVVGFTLHLFISILSTVKYQTTRWLLHYTRLLFVSWVWNVSFSLALVYASTWIVVNIAPDAAGSGVPQLIAYLNGYVLSRCCRGAV